MSTNLANQSGLDAPSTSKEVVEAIDLERRIITLCQQFPAGVTDKKVQQDMPNIDAQQRVMAINRLLSMGQIDLMRQGNELLYRLKDPNAAQKVKGADTEEKLVYQIVEKAGNKGIWIRDIRFQSNLTLTQVNKILKSLESKKLIKAVKSVAASKKKVYMLYNLEPDRTITGGTWYSDQDFESEFVEVLNQQCYKFLMQRASIARDSMSDPLARENASYVSSEEICKHVAEVGISKVQLSVEDIETILDTLIYDGKVEKSVIARRTSKSDQEPSSVKVYRAIEAMTPPAGLVRVPCGFCPFVNECSEGGIISPLNCQYIKEWLDN